MERLFIPTSLDEDIGQENHKLNLLFFFFSSRRRHTRCGRDWSSDVCSSDLTYRVRLFFNFAPVPVLTELEQYLRKLDTLPFTNLLDYVEELKKAEDEVSDEMGSSYELSPFHKRMVKIGRAHV